MSDRLWSRINDQPLPYTRVNYIGVPQWVIRSITVLTFQLFKLVPTRFLVGQICGPSYVGDFSLDELSGPLISELDFVSNPNLPACRMGIVISINSESRSLPFNASLRVFKCGDRLLYSVFQNRVSLAIAFYRKSSGGLRGQVELRAISEAGNSDSRVNFIDRRHSTSYFMVGQSIKLSETASNRSASFAGLPSVLRTTKFTRIA